MFKKIQNFKTNLSQTYSSAYKYCEIGPIYYEYGLLIIAYDNADIAVKVYYMLRESQHQEKDLLVLLLPNVMPELITKGVRVRRAHI